MNFQVLQHKVVQKFAQEIISIPCHQFEGIHHQQPSKRQLPQRHPTQNAAQY